jgi:hypothetical protein
MQRGIVQSDLVNILGIGYRPLVGTIMDAVACIPTAVQLCPGVGALRHIGDTGPLCIVADT